MTTEERKNKAHRMLNAIDEDVSEAFCTGCEAREVRPATEIDPEDESCPADFDPSDPGCAKAHQYRELLEYGMGLIGKLEAV